MAPKLIKHARNCKNATAKQIIVVLNLIFVARWIDNTTIIPVSMVNVDSDELAINSSFMSIQSDVHVHYRLA